ncbi:hypothetical protein P3T76_015913 [Phytophthora citrophthora]|uniref:Uncharacterized protein n=1 Tax=Phytophthora citrophthora TaxID=4793 RepID=A0AAD9LAM2_9STRA|nr:hypothetical protein P3T76_015913 [Phytophthora citrophthora]
MSGKESSCKVRFLSLKMSSEPWDFDWMLAAVQSLETYEAALETAEFPSLILAALDELLQTPEANAAPLQDVTAMIEFPIDTELPRETVTMLHATRDWAIQTLLDLQTQSATPMPKCLQQMQDKLFVSAPCRPADVQMELRHSLLAALQTEEEDSDTVSQVLEMCATSIEADEQFLQFAETALTGKTETLTLGSSFLHRLFDRQRRLFDTLTLESRVRVWANHLPSWRSQVQTWMLETQRAPFKPIHAVLPEGWMESVSQGDVGAICRRYSHLYVTLIDWCRCNVDLLSSCRSNELVSVLSRSTRPENAVRLFNRQLLRRVELTTRSRNQRERAFISLGRNLDRLQSSRSSSELVWQFEWIGVLEQPQLLHEALKTVFSIEAADRPAFRSAVQFLSWFYSFISSESSDEIASVITAMSSELRCLDVPAGAQWLRRNRADFGSLPILRLRFVWFWLLKSIETGVQTSKSETIAATIDALESLEYTFRRFTPPRAKRPFQVEFVTQLVVELEWRAASATCSTTSNDSANESFLEGIGPLCGWLEKIVRLMQLEEQKDNRNGHRNSVNDVQHLAERLQSWSR